MNSFARISWSLTPSALNPFATQRKPSPAACGFDGCESAARTISPSSTSAGSVRVYFLHGGGDFTKQFVRYRNIRVKRLDTAAK